MRGRGRPSRVRPGLDPCSPPTSPAAPPIGAVPGAQGYALRRRRLAHPRRQILKQLPKCLLRCRMPTAAAQLDRAFHALADPSRRSIVVRLSRGPASVSELAAPLAMSLPSVVQHIDVLQRSGLVRSEKVGRVRTCRLEPAPLHRSSSGSPSTGPPGRGGWIASATSSTRPTEGPGMSVDVHDTFTIERRYRAHAAAGLLGLRRPRAEAAVVRESGQLAERRLGARLPRRRRRALERRLARMQAQRVPEPLPRHRPGRADRVRLRPAARRPPDLGVADDDRAHARGRRHAARAHRAGRVLRRPRGRGGTQERDAASCSTGSARCLAEEEIR